MMRIVIGTPRSARMSDSSSSSQLMGLPANCLASDSRKFMFVLLSRAEILLGMTILLKRFNDPTLQPITIPSSPAHERGDPNLFGYGREYRSQIGRNPRRRMPLPVQLPR